MTEAIAFKEHELDKLEERQKHTITVVGCGRMGFPIACLFFKVGFKVICFDSNPYVIAQINKGNSPYPELGLDRFLKENAIKGQIHATIDPKPAVSESDIIILVVDTSIDKKKRSDYSNLEECCRIIGLNLKPGTLIIVESTVGPTVTETLVKETIEQASGLKAGEDFGLAYSPIRATIGKTIENVIQYSKIVAGIDNKSLSAAKAVLKTITEGELIETNNIKTAETIKLFENVYRDVNIALANEFAEFCEKAGIDYYLTQVAANTQPFCHLLKPGIVSGHVHKDPYLLISEAENLGVRLKITTMARRVNDEALNHAYRLVKEAIHACNKPVKRSKVALLGVSFRSNVKAARGSLIPELVKLLRKRGVKVSVFDPFYSYKELVEFGYPAERTLSKTVERADCLLIAVGHDRFKRLGLRKISLLMKKPPAIVDFAQVINPQKAEREGFTYRGLGRGIWAR